MSKLKIVIVGAGLGGLCLAQSLRRAGIDAQVYERDRGFWDRPQGYRLHLDEDGIHAMRASLTAEHRALFEATSMSPLDFTTILSPSFDIVRRVGSDVHNSTGDDGASQHMNVDRATLRQLLFAGLEDAVHFGEKLVRYDSDEHGVTAHLASGLEVKCDVLVGADGIHSAVRKQRAPDAQVMDTGVRAIYGRVPLEVAKKVMPATALTDVFTVAVNDDKVFLGLGPVVFPTPPHVAASWLQHRDDYVVSIVGGLLASFHRDDATLRAMSPAQIQEVACDVLRAFPEAAQAVPRAGDPTSFFVVEMSSSIPTPLAPSPNVTLLGDAIHAMTPTLGRGANVAMRDGVNLARSLVEVSAGRISLPDALARYEAEMTSYGFDVVRKAAAMGARLMGQKPLPA